MKALRIALIALAALGFIAAFCIVSNCDYEDYCRSHGVECETETQPAWALIPTAVALLAGVGVGYIENKEGARYDR